MIITKSIWTPILVCCSLALGCGGEPVESDERVDLEQLGGKADLPGWLKPVAVDWGCDQTLEGKFTGWDSAHLYSFPGKIGYSYDFTFKADYAKTLGAVVAVYDSETGQRVAYKRNRWSNSAKVTYVAKKSVKYLVAAYSVAPYAVGTYALRADCTLLVVTCQGDFACAKGEFCKFPVGNCGAANLGACTTIPQICTKEYKPVCGCDGKTYGNKCEADGAGVSIKAADACAKNSCETAGGYCTYFLKSCDPGYVGGAPMDCPMGKSGMCCLPAPEALVTLKTDKTGYRVNETINVELKNGLSESLFVSGCSVLGLQELVGGVWSDPSPDKVCFWEGIAGQVKAGASYSAALTRSAGTFRVVVDYGLGCAPGKPLSQAGCASSAIVRSESFTVKDCPMLSMPNPATFCPTGKIVARYDAEGICISGYDCVPCAELDCGPAMGMPNTICPDGKTVAGPTGTCLPTGWGSCAWEVISCPEPK